jgi:hypothetical protein
MDIGWFEFILLGLSAFRLTRLMVFDKITAFIRNPFLNEIEEIDEDGQIETYLEPKEGVIKGFVGELLSCYWCTGVWASITLCTFYMIYPTFAIPILVILAVAGVAAIIETIIQVWL